MVAIGHFTSCESGDKEMNGYISVQEAAEKWNVTPRQVQFLSL